MQTTNLTCGICQQAAKSYQALVMHAAKRHGSKVYFEPNDLTCPLCGKRNTSYALLRGHFQHMHQGEALPLPPPHFTPPRLIEREPGESPGGQCPLCSWYRPPTRGALLQHMKRLHPGVSVPLQCPQCSRVFEGPHAAQGLAMHVRRQHEGFDPRKAIAARKNGGTLQGREVVTHRQAMEAQTFPQQPAGETVGASPSIAQQLQGVLDGLNQRIEELQGELSQAEATRDSLQGLIANHTKGVAYDRAGNG